MFLNLKKNTTNIKKLNFLII